MDDALIDFNFDVEEQEDIFLTRKERIRRFFKRLFRNKLVLFSLIILIILVFLAIFAPWIVPEDPYRSVLQRRLQAPSWENLFGTDQQGRDMVSRVIMGSRVALYVGFLSVGIGLSIGGLLGLISGYFGKMLDTIIMRTMDVIMSFPWLLLVITVVSILGTGITNAMLAISITLIPQYARLVRSVVVSVREQDFVQGAEALGASHLRIIFIHIAPHTAAHVIILSTINLGKAILAEAGLGYLGLGVQPPTPSWGMMISSGQNYLLVNPYLSIILGIAVMLVVISLNIFGDGLRDALDPKL